MLKALQLIFEPATTWDAIARANRSVPALFCLYVLPAMLIAGALEGWGLHALGNQPSIPSFMDQTTSSVPFEKVLRYEVFQFIVTLLMLGLLTYSLHLTSHSLHNRTNRTQAFTVVAYCFGPVFLMQAVDGLPFINSWVCSAAGLVLAVRAFYTGLPLVMKPDPAKAIGLFLMGAFLMVFFIGLSHFVSLQVLEGGLLNSITFP